jgi:hypothetical protein
MLCSRRHIGCRSTHETMVHTMRVDDAAGVAGLVVRQLLEMVPTRSHRTSRYLLLSLLSCESDVSRALGRGGERERGQTAARVGH